MLLLTFTYSLTWTFVLWKQRVQKNLAILNKRTRGGCSCLCMLLSVIGIVFLVVVIWLLVKYLWWHNELPNLSSFSFCLCFWRVHWSVITKFPDFPCYFLNDMEFVEVVKGVVLQLTYLTVCISCVFLL